MLLHGLWGCIAQYVEILLDSRFGLYIYIYTYIYIYIHTYISYDDPEWLRPSYLNLSKSVLKTRTSACLRPYTGGCCSVGKGFRVAVGCWLRCCAGWAVPQRGNTVVGRWKCTGQLEAHWKLECRTWQQS